MDSENVSRGTAKDLLSIGAVFFRPDEPFTWASGIKSPIYCDNRLTLSAPAVRERIEQALAQTVKERFPEAEALMGTSTAGIAHAAITRLHSWACPWAMSAAAPKTTGGKTGSRAAWNRGRRWS